MSAVSIERAPFGTMPDGATVEQVTLRGADGFEAVIITYGAAIHALKVPDRAGQRPSAIPANTTRLNVRPRKS